MSLKGSLGSFAIADIFQLIGQQQKSGVLTVNGQENTARFFFSKGLVVLGTMGGQRKDLLLGNIFVSANVISEEQLTEAVNIQKTQKKTLGEILVQQEFITLDELKEFLSLQLDEVISDVLQWKIGTYEFSAEKVSYNEKFVNPRGIEGLLMDCYRKSDEWPSIISKVGNLEMIFEKNKQVTLENFDDPMEQKVFSHINGVQSLKQIAFISRIGTFEAAKYAASLLDKQAIHSSGRTQNTVVGDHTGGMVLDIKQIVIYLLLGFFLGYFIASPTSSIHLATYPGRRTTGRILALDFNSNSFYQKFVQSSLTEQVNRYELEEGKAPKTLSEISDNHDFVLEQATHGMKVVPE